MTIPAGLAIGLVALAGCGSSTKSSTSTKAASASPASAPSNPYPSAGTGAATASTTPAALTLTTKHDKLGTILAAGPKRLTVYLFEADRAGRSACSGACASVWPPVPATGTARATGAARSASLGTITRSDGTRQLTYKGHPLYYFARDRDDGDAYGQGIRSFGAGWYALAPSGAKVDHS